jgi:argininosuccinate lyase
MKKRKTLVGVVDDEVLAFTVGRDQELDLVLAEADCIGTAAHVTMLDTAKGLPRLFRRGQRRAVVTELVGIIRRVRAGRFAIGLDDQDIHLAVERRLTDRLGDVGRRVHTARSRNDQIAVDLRLYAKEQLLGAIEEAAQLADALLRFGHRHRRLPMVGRTHLQPAMPSSVGVWASAHAEGLLDDIGLLRAAYEFNDVSPLGSAAGYGVPLRIDRAMTARLLGFQRPYANVLQASSARGKCESVILGAMAQVMATVGRLAEDLILFSMPEFGYFALPPEFCTGSSIMPQKRNPDVLELTRARATRVAGLAFETLGIVKTLPSGYQRDLQETKEPFIEGVRATRACLRVLARLVGGMKANAAALRAAFGPGVFATDLALELVVAGVPFREAYDRVKADLPALRAADPGRAVARFARGGGAEVAFGELAARTRAAKAFASNRRRRFYVAISRLLDVRYPELT